MQENVGYMRLEGYPARNCCLQRNAKEDKAGDCKDTLLSMSSILWLTDARYWELCLIMKASFRSMFTADWCPPALIWLHFLIALSQLLSLLFFCLSTLFILVALMLWYSSLFLLASCLHIPLATGFARSAGYKNAEIYMGNNFEEFVKDWGSFSLSLSPFSLILSLPVLPAFCVGFCVVLLGSALNGSNLFWATVTEVGTIAAQLSSSCRTGRQGRRGGPGDGTVTLWFWACVCNLRQFCAANLINSLLSHLAAVANFSGLCCVFCLCCLSAFHPAPSGGKPQCTRRAAKRGVLEGGLWSLGNVLCGVCAIVVAPFQ